MPPPDDIMTRFTTVSIVCAGYTDEFLPDFKASLGKFAAWQEVHVLDRVGDSVTVTDVLGMPAFVEVVKNTLQDIFTDSRFWNIIILCKRTRGAECVGLMVKDLLNLALDSQKERRFNANCFLLSACYKTLHVDDTAAHIKASFASRGARVTRASAINNQLTIGNR